MIGISQAICCEKITFKVTYSTLRQLE